MSAYEYLSQEEYYYLSRLEELGHECDIGIPRRNIKYQIDVLCINFKFLDMFLILQSFSTTVCSDATQRVQALFSYAAAEFKIIDFPVMLYACSMSSNNRFGRLSWKSEVSSFLTQTKHPLPLSSKVAATPEFIKRFIDTVVRNLSDLSEICDPDTGSPLVPCSTISWLNLPNGNRGKQYSASAKMNASFPSLQMRIQPIQPYSRTPFGRATQAQDGAFKDQMTMLNLLRANLINLPREALEDFDTAIIDAGLLVYSLYDSMEEKEDRSVGESNPVPVLDLSGDIQRVIAKAYEVEQIVVSCINKDISEWCFVHWTGEIIEEITLLIRITSMSEDMVGFDRGGGKAKEAADQER
ncbi:hypothetical protein HAX54_033315 [Datura stramonium]|uniref:Late blight resistance protein R1A-like N-terminal domain-containing protein n=1 Tax=Datura stramonium TaxID=4076 RepID=A0ABS8SD96_DATST|nr:hypothetical protein [Datura stramonium]